MANEAVLNQLSALALAPDRPLVICDVDEVVVHFTRALEAYLARHDHYLDAASLALDGNIRRRFDNAPAPRQVVGELIESFFVAHTHELEPIDGAVEALVEIGGHANVVMLSNLPPGSADHRRKNLRGLGLDYPLVVNSGPKGPAVKALAQIVDAPSVFIDDSPHFIASARQHAPDVHLIHFMHDERFARFVEPYDYLSLRTGSWLEARPHMLELIQGSLAKGELLQTNLSSPSSRRRPGPIGRLGTNS
jgi:FMN phosphatase YigB (HAD superfamily)